MATDFCFLFGSRFVFFLVPFSTRSQARHYLTWAQWVLTVVAASANVVVLMLDETMVPLTFWGRAGNVVKVSKAAQGHTMTENVGVGDQKASIALIATICNDPALQPHLKQILLPKGKRKKDSEEFSSTWPKKNMPPMPENVEVWEKTSGWVKGADIIRYMKLQRQVVQQHRPGATIVLSYDCCPAHLDKKVLQYASRWFGPILLIPGQLGWVFDILDTKVFHPMKHSMAEDSMFAKVEGKQTSLSKQQRCKILYDNIGKFLTSADYSAEFPRHGLSTSFASLREPIKDLCDGSCLDAPPRKLTKTELDELLGMKRSIYGNLFQGSRYSHLDAMGRPIPGSSGSASASSSSSAPVLPAPVVPVMAMGSKLPGFKKL